MRILYTDAALVVCIKPAGALSTDEPGGVPELVRAELGDAAAEVRTVHRLDRVVGGLMVLARSAPAASELSRQIREGGFGKEYLAVVHGEMPARGELKDLLWRDKARRMTFVVQERAKGVQDASLEYETLARAGDMSKLRIVLHTGRTHQIRCQFAAHGHPLLGDRKYGLPDDGTDGIALWSHSLTFTHPESGMPMSFTAEPPQAYPWTLFWLP